MKSVQTLYQALGKIVYAIANAALQGNVVQKEDELIHKILSGEIIKHKKFADAADVLHQMNKDSLELQSTYQLAIDDMEKNGDKLSPEMKTFFIAVIKKVAAVYPPVTIGQQNIVDRFIHDTSNIGFRPATI